MLQQFMLLDILLLRLLLWDNYFNYIQLMCYAN